ncbi:stomatin-like protein 1 [Daphnia magna]|uniref:Band 7 domain-containing protein n=1 Tax=Daphnia magna TaxID=35525 RepID=A0ABQ9Z583_9CRUS|nr:stomatin-like protein 1 [Daphnia magna]KAK4008054.1 hypothetical protein OUZ56_013211 [Daphnia magna]
MSILSEKSYFTYSTVPQDDRNVESGYKTAFDYKSIFSYDSAFKDKDGSGQNSASGEKCSEDITSEGLSEKAIAALALAFSYLFIFFTLPITVWFCFKNLPQWERIVIYRLGKLIGVRGPGNVFLIPWLDCSTKLDLRTQVICHPLKQFLTKDQAIVEAACSVFYRIGDPVRYISNVQDPELKGLKILANAIVMKRLEAADAREFQAARKAVIEERILKELNSITTPWGIEISSAHIENIRTLKEAQPVNAFMNVMQQMGINFGSGDGATAGPAVPPSVSVADVGMVIQDELRPKSKNAIKLRRILDEGPGVLDNPVVICFKIGNEDVIYADFTQGKGQVYEGIFSGTVGITLSLPQELFDSLMDGASQSQFLQAYLEGQITIDGDMQTLMQLQKLLPNMQST